MRAQYHGGGLLLDLSDLSPEEKERLSKEGGTLECTVRRFEKVKVFLHITDRPIVSGEEASGFHIEGTPYEGGIEHREKYDIWLSRTHFDRITHPKDSMLGGYFASRCFYDRVDIVYAP